MPFPPTRAILHLDMDAFFASVEVLDAPDLRGQPVIVGAGVRGVVAAASYEARRFGVHSALPLAIARRRCPQGVFLTPRPGRYREVSAQIMAIFRRFTPLVEPLSLDEAFLDVSASVRLFGPAVQVAETIRALVRAELGLTVSAGVATSKLVAKIASDMKKPDGLTVVPAGGEVDFLTPLAITKLPGVGPATERQLVLLGVRTIGDLARLPAALLARKLGQAGSQLWAAAHGIDERPVEADRPLQSIGHEETFAEDLVDLDQIRRELLALALRVGKRLRRYGLVARKVVVKVKYYDFVQVSRSLTLVEPTADHGELYRAGRRLLVDTQAGAKPLRLLGITAAGLEDQDLPRQASLFGAGDEREERRRRVNQALDRINDTFGRHAIRPATLLEGE